MESVSKSGQSLFSMLKWVDIKNTFPKWDTQHNNNTVDETPVIIKVLLLRSKLQNLHIRVIEVIVQTM